MIGDNRSEEGTHKNLGAEGRVQLEIKERTFEPTWESGAGGYLRGNRGCGLSATEKREGVIKNQLLIHNQLWICFHLNITGRDCIIQCLLLILHYRLFNLKVLDIG